MQVCLKNVCALTCVFQLGIPALLSAQSDSAQLPALVREAISVNPAVRAARNRIEAARARVVTSSLRPDPMLMAGIVNLPISGARFGDFMTMKMVGVSQTFPTGGKLSLRRSIAEREADVADANADVVKKDVERDVKSAFYEIAFLAQARDIVRRDQELLVTFIRIAEGRYSVGMAAQQDALKAQLEASRLSETAVQLAEQERAAKARLNSILARASDASVGSAAIPHSITDAAIANPSEIRFESPALGSRAADSPLPPLIELQNSAVKNNPELRAQQAMAAAQAARLELTRKERIPDVDVGLQYGQRDRYPDMVTATVSLPFPLQRRRNQDAFVGESRAELAALQSDYAARENAIRADVARAVSEVERERAQLALLVKVILPQSRATLNSAIASYQVGKVEFLTVLENQSTLFTIETDYARLLADFATSIAELERLTGAEIIQ